LFTGKIYLTLSNGRISLTLSKKKKIYIYICVCVCARARAQHLVKLRGARIGKSPDPYMLGLGI